MNQQAAAAVPAADQSEQLVTAAPAVRTGHPLGFFFIFFGEFAERCSYYGMRAILPLYLTTVLAFSDAAGGSIYFGFKTACYFLPLLGGWLADRFFGRYWTIVGFSVPYVLGHFILGLETPFWLFIALILLAGGSGVIKPNISTLMGQTYDQKRPGQEALRSSAFLWFYVSINIGAVISQIAMPWIRTKVANTYHDVPMAYRIAFLFPAILMVISLLVFAFGKPFYAVEKIERHPPTTPEERAQRFRVVMTLLGIFVTMVFFWVAYEHNDSLWIFFARDHMAQDLPGSEVKTCIVNFGLFQVSLSPDGFQFVNPGLIIVLVPLLGWFLAKVDPRGQRFRPTRKIMFGFLCTAASIGIMTLAAMQASGGARVSPWWLLSAYLVLTLGEILLYGTGLELSYAAAPANMKGFITACFLVTIALGNFINMGYARLFNTVLPPEKFFALTTCIVLAAAVAFYFVGKQFDRASEARPEAATA